MFYGYKITNNENGRIYYGIAENSRYILSRHLGLLREDKHWLKLLQKDYNEAIKKEGLFKKEILIGGDDEEVFNYIYDNIIRDETYLAHGGYNLPFMAARNDILYLSDEDIIFYFLENGKGPTLKKFNISNNVLLYRLKRNLLKEKEKIKISTYDDFYAYAELLLTLNGNFLKASQILDMMISRFTISTRIRMTQNKISKNLSIKPYIQKEKRLGYFYYKIS